jgi:hypothetical protein
MDVQAPALDCPAAFGSTAPTIIDHYEIPKNPAHRLNTPSADHPLADAKIALDSGLCAAWLRGQPHSFDSNSLSIRFPMLEHLPWFHTTWLFGVSTILRKEHLAPSLPWPSCPRNGRKIQDIFEPVWVTGVVAAKSIVRDLFLVNGSSGIQIGYALQTESIAPYKE